VLTDELVGVDLASADRESPAQPQQPPRPDRFSLPLV